ncbi:ATP-binding protein [Streptomyces griseus]|uniref:wHTH domain-containing protein n=1 Tax=Streptomyces griseus TaxID=1911 RepID=UPI00386E99A9|nr:ATP-binding protein [Streptomyces griseus]WTD66558.1 ATP-binding protein [Streptomyces griseus]
MSPDEITNIINGGVYNDAVIQAARVTLQTPPATTPPSEPWVRAVLESGVWAHAAPRGVEAHVQQAARLVERLAGVRDAAEQRIDGDAWADPGFAARFADRGEWLLGEPDGALDLYPAEAGVLVLLPYVYQVHRLLLVSSHLEVDPTDLRARPQATGERARYQSFLAGQSLLVHRAKLRPEAAEVIGWWLYHRWLAKEEKGEDQLAVLAAEIAEESGPLAEALNPRRLARILTGLRLGPEVCNPEHLGQLEADELLPGPGRQRFRERRASLLLSVAYSAAAELTALPDTVVEHTGIPGAVDLDGVRRTLARMAWGGSAELPVLKAVCEHEAVVEALREHGERLDGLLLAVGRTLPDRIAQPMPALPTRISSDGVEPAEGTFTSGARFRLDDRRMRGLLTGTQLYKDRGLAVRELYQNALDACRYRRARTQFLERSGRPFHPYEGRIEFVQGTDDDGREYLECVDDGIGMGEAELRGVYSDAGSRFVEQPDFLLEQAEWERVEPPVRLHPNSRFGIGVLSYFMLADEIRVTSCRMGLDGVPGPLVEAHIFGPNHMFRIVEKTERGTAPGTRVRLYLREPRRSWSALETLAEVLCVAEFRTVVAHGGRQRVWEAGVFRPATNRTHGELVEWHDSPPGAQVIWCQAGGMLLVDGLAIRPRHEVGVMSGLLGVVVNLSGDHAPRQLSTDRLTVLTDISAQVEEMLKSAAPALVESEAAFLTLAWLEDVAKSSPRTADLVAEAARTAGRAFLGPERVPVPVEAGCFPLDRALLPRLLASNRHASQPTSVGFSSIPDHILLWRILAHGESDLSRELTELVPELSEPRQVTDARPSDLELLTGNRGGFGITRPSDAFGIARRLGCSPVGPAERRRLFGVADLVVPESSGSDEWDVSDMTWLDCPYESRRAQATIGDLLEIGEKLGVSAARAAELLRSFNIAVVPDELPEEALDEVDLHLLYRDGEIAKYAGVWSQGPVPPGHLARVALDTGLSPHEVRRRLERYGIAVEPFGFPEKPDEEYVSWLSRDHNGMWPWVSSAAPLPPWQLVAVQGWLDLTAEEVRAEYERLGFTLPPRGGSPESPDDFHLLAGYGEGEWAPFRTDRAPRFHQLVEVAEDLGLSLRTLTTRLAAYGVRVGMTLPQRETELDRDLFRYDDLLRITGEVDDRDLPWWFSLTPEDEIPFFLLVLAARDLGRRPKELASRLRTYGLRVSRDDLPPGLGQRDALRLLTADDYAVPRSANPPMPLAQLVRIARRVDLPVVDTAGHLRDLGVHVDDVARTVRTALARVPLSEGEALS